MIEKKDLLSLVVIFLLIFSAMSPLFHSGFFPMHDNEQVGRLYDLHQALVAGHIPPRIAPNLGFGYGYPFFNFYPPFAYYIAEIFKLVGFSYITSIKIMVGLGFIIAAFAMYFLTKEFFGRIAGIVSAIAYTYAPYHGVDAYVRGAFPEFWSFAIIPSIFWAYYKLGKQSTYRYMVLASFLNACLILTHNLIAFMSAPFIGAFILLMGFYAKRKSPFFFASIISILFGLAIPAYFWLTSFLEKQYTMVDLLTTELANYSLHFVYLRQFWDSPWGYGGSIPGPYDGLTFQVGKVQLIFAIGAITFATGYFLKKNTAFVAQKRFIMFFVFFLLFGLSLFMATSYSQFIWDSMQPLWYIQFPWRYLLFSSFTSAFLIGGIFIFDFMKQAKYKLSFAFIVLVSLILINKDYFQPERYIKQAKDSDYTNQETLRFETSKIAAEYVPKGIATRKSDIQTTIIDIDKNSFAKASFSVVSGDLKVEEIKNIPQEKEFIAIAKTQGILRINTYTFPGWKVFIDQKEVAYNADNKLKLITVALPQGSHRVQVIFTDTLVRKVGNTLSIISILLLTGLLFLPKRFHFPGF